MRFIHVSIKNILCLSVISAYLAIASYAYADSAAVRVINTSGGGQVDIVVRNISDNNPAPGGIITWSNVTAGQTGWKVADQYIEISHNKLPQSWGMQIYTDNKNEALADPKYTGKANPAGLIKTDNTILALPMAWRITDSTISNPANPVQRQDSLGFNDYMWRFLKDKNTPDDSATLEDESFQNGDDYVTLWNQSGIAWNEGGRSGNPQNARIYLAANFAIASVDSVYKTSALTIEAYKGISVFPIYVYKDGAPAVQMAYEHISFQMDKYFQGREKRLIESYADSYPSGPAGSLEGIAFTYDNALAISAYLARPTKDNLRRAKLLCKSLIHVQEPDGRVRDAYYATDNFDVTTEPSPAVGFNSVSTGNVSFFINALMHYYKNSNDTDAEFLNELLEAAKKAGDFIHTLYHFHLTKAGYYHGYNSDGTPNTSKSTEHNIAAYVAFSHIYDITKDDKWLTRANIAKGFVDNIAWQPGHKRYICGLNTDGGLNESTLTADTNILAVLAMGDLAKNNDAIDYTIEKFHKRINLLNGNDNIDEQPYLEGIDFGYNVHDSATEPDGIWFEGTAQLAAAYKVAGYYGYADHSDRYLESIKLAQYNALNANYKGVTAASKDNLTTGLGWHYFASPHIAPTAWFAATSLDYNMLWGNSLSETIPSPGDNRSFTADPVSLIDNTNYLENHYIASGFMNYKSGVVTVDPRYTDNPYSGDTCFKISWNGQAGAQYKWGGIVWQEPEGKWDGGLGYGYDLQGAKYLTFRIRTDDFSLAQGGNLKAEVYFGYAKKGSKGDSCSQVPSTAIPVTLTTQWQQHSIFIIDKDMSHVSNGFTIVFNDTNTPRKDNRLNIYLDEIKFDTW